MVIINNGIPYNPLIWFKKFDGTHTCEKGQINENITVLFSFLDYLKFGGTDCIRYSRTFYMRIRLFTFAKIFQNDNFPVKNGLFICDFKIRGLK